MSGEYTLTPNLGLFKPEYGLDAEQWGFHWNDNADRLDQFFGNSTAGPFLPLAGGEDVTGPVNFTGAVSFSGPLSLTGPINYTATGGTTARSAQDRAGSFLTPEDFGAKGDSTTDDSNAFDAYTAYLRTQFNTSTPQLAWVLGYGRRYYVTRSIDLTNFSHYRFEGNHSIILSSERIHPCIDMLGSSNCVLANLRMFNGSQAAPALVGITFGVYGDVQGHPNVTLDNCEIDGFYTRACVQNSGSEVNLILNPIFINRYVSGTLGQTFCLIQDGLHHWDLNSHYIVDTRGRDNYYSFLGQEIIGGAMQNVGDGSCIWNGGGSEHHYRNTYMQTYEQVPMAVLRFNPTGAGIYKNDFIWECNSENQPSSIFFITGAPVCYLNGFTLRSPGCMVNATGAVFTAGSDVSQVRIIDAVIQMADYNYPGSKVFAPGSKFTFNGKFLMLNQNFDHWNAPAGGFLELMTDDNTGFNAGMFSMQSWDNGGLLTIGAAEIIGLTAHGGTFTGNYAGDHTYTGNTIHNGTMTLPGVGVSLALNDTATMDTIHANNFYYRSDNAVLMKYESSINGIRFTIGANTFEFRGDGTLQLFGTQILRGRIGGWTAPTGTATRSTFLTSSVTLPVLAEHVKALIDDLTLHGLIGT